jgi:Protein of unknown function (DUF5672)
MCSVRVLLPRVLPQTSNASAVMTEHPVVVVPVYRQHDSNYDRLSLAHLRKYLSNYNIVAVGPPDLAWHRNEFDYREFPDHFFLSHVDYNKLLLSEQFYRRFSEFSHVLIYQLDALVFRDELSYWCQQPYDYIGSTFYRDLIEQVDKYKWPYAKVGCCNGGFSLRRVDSFLTHLTARPSTFKAAMTNLARLKMPSSLMLLRYRNHLDPRSYLPHESLNEDVYYGVFSNKIGPPLKVPPAKVSNRFAFENIPDEVFHRARGVLPFGCHAWYKTYASFQFWRPYLLYDPT